MKIDWLIFKNKQHTLEVVLSGRNPDKRLLEMADYVSEVCKRKHPKDRGIPARVGIENKLKKGGSKHGITKCVTSGY